MALSSKERDALPASDFAVPGKRQLPMHDAKHARLAWDMVNRTGGLSDSEKSTARSRIKRRAKELGIDTSDWGEDVHGEAELHLLIKAMSINVPHVEDHPNRMPFSGVLTRVDQPSDAAPGGASGKRAYLPKIVAEAMLPSLLSMPIDMSDGFEGHNVRQKIGTITGARIEGDALLIEGFFYSSDFPEECAAIQADKEALGFSYEIQARTEPMAGGFLKIVSGVFTGAAVLRKDRAAYHSTSIAAAIAPDKEIDAMTKEELAAIVAEAVKPLQDELTALKKGTETLAANAMIRDKIQPHIDGLRSCAAAMEAAGVGMHPQRGHVAVLNHMASSMEADAAQGKVPHIYRDHDWTFASRENPPKDKTKEQEDMDAAQFKALTESIAALSAKVDSTATTVTDLKASAFRASAEPVRRSIPPDVTALLAKNGIKDAPKEGITEQALDKMLEGAGVPPGQKSIAMKLQFSQAGLLAR